MDRWRRTSTSILVKYMLKLGINLKTIAQLSMNIAVVSISKRAGIKTVSISVFITAEKGRSSEG